MKVSEGRAAPWTWVRAEDWSGGVRQREMAGHRARESTGLAWELATVQGKGRPLQRGVEPRLKRAQEGMRLR